MNAVLKPDVSVVMATYNSYPFLTDTLASIKQQSLHNFELIVADDGSSDQHTMASLREMASGDERVQLIERPHCGLRPIAGNCAFRAARGEFIVWLDDDDPMLPARLEETVRAFRLAPPTAGLLFSDYHVIDKVGALRHGSGLDRYSHLLQAPRRTLCDGVYLLAQSVAFHTLLVGNYLRPSNVAMRRACLDDVGLLDETLENGDDLDLFLRIARKWDFVWVQKALGTYRERPGNISSRSPLRLAPNRIRVLEKQFQAGMLHKDRRVARQKIAENLFDIGYAQRTQGRYDCAVPVLARSLMHRISWNTFKELALSITMRAVG